MTPISLAQAVLAYGLREAEREGVPIAVAVADADGRPVLVGNHGRDQKDGRLAESLATAAAVSGDSIVSAGWTAGPAVAGDLRLTLAVVSDDASAAGIYAAIVESLTAQQDRFRSQ